jgi:integrase/recombinase XerD
MFKGISIYDFRSQFKTENDCYSYLFEKKWKNGYKCSKCGHDKAYKGRTCWYLRCAKCKYDESVKANTLFHKMKLPILKAFEIMFTLSNRKKGMSALEIARTYDINPYTASLLRKKTQSGMFSSGKNISNRPNKTTGGTLNLKTTHTHFIIIRDLFTMLQEEKKIEVNPCNTLKYPYPEQSEERIILTQKEIQELYKATQTAQERAILSLAYGCGFRCGEIVLCNIEDVRLREKIIIVPKGKGNKRRVVPLSNGVIKDLADYYYKEREELTKGRDYELNPISNQQAFMLHSRGGRIRQHSCNKYLRQIIERTENKTIIEKNISLHNLRHSIASHLLEQGIPTEQVRLFLGHNQLETTQIYTHINQKQLRNIKT